MRYEEGKTTVSCKKMWELIAQVGLTNLSLQLKLENAFADFECDWERHAEEYHTNKEEQR